MPQLRTKKVEKDGLEFTIAELTNRQVEEFFSAQSSDTAPQTAGSPDKETRIRERTRQIIAYSFNNQQMQSEEGLDPWTPDRVNNELGFSTVNWLFGEILAFSGLKADVPEDGKKNASASPVQ